MRRILMTLVGRYVGLPPPVTRRVDVERDVPVAMRDGTVLRADHYAPRLTGPAPTVLVRTPYGRGGLVGLLCRAVAERGTHVLVQSCRGTSDSGGVFEPLVDERADGLDTLDWLDRQEWHDGRVLTYGPSYAGIVQWAVAPDAGDRITAMATIVTASQFGGSTYAGGSFSLDSVLTWSALLAAQRTSGFAARVGGLVELLRGQPRLHRGLAHHPLSAADTVAIGAEVGFYQRWLAENDPSGEYWSARGHSARLAEVRAPVLMVGGRYDIFLPWQLEDYAALRAAGARPYLTIGPWHHGSPGLFRQSAAESVTWFGHHTSGTPFRHKPVRVHVGGVDEWREYEDWPPPTGRVGWRLGVDLRPDKGTGFTYDPADPTPAVGGPRLVGNVAGTRDNRDLEARADVLTHTGAPLTGTVELIGPVTASVEVGADSPYFDVFVRLCDVDPDGRSWNVCDGLTRVTSAGPVHVELWPTAYAFRPGHRVRVQISGGAHPRFARNPGTGAALGADGELRKVRIEVVGGEVTGGDVMGGDVTGGTGTAPTP